VAHDAIVFQSHSDVTVPNPISFSNDRTMVSDRPSPYSVSLCALIGLHAEPESPLYAASNLANGGVEEVANEGIATSPISVADMDSFLQHQLQQDQSINQPCSIRSLVQSLHDSVGFLAASRFQQWIIVATQTLDALDELMSTVAHSVHHGTVDPESTCGVYIRKCTLGYDDLSFEATTLLWKECQCQVNDLLLVTQLQERTRSASLVDEATSSNMHALSESHWPLSPDQIESLMQNECRKFGFDFRENRVDNGASTFNQRHVAIQQILCHHPELPAAHFLHFLHCVQQGDRLGATDALHQYFDYAFSYGEDRALATSVSYTPTILQFAAILLASMHYDFGDITNSLQATDEAVRVAQQSKVR
jgi:hypothetical protein